MTLHLDHNIFLITILLHMKIRATSFYSPFVCHSHIPVRRLPEEKPPSRLSHRQEVRGKSGGVLYLRKHASDDDRRERKVLKSRRAPGKIIMFQQGRTRNSREPFRAYFLGLGDRLELY